MCAKKSNLKSTSEKITILSASEAAQIVGGRYLCERCGQGYGQAGGHDCPKEKEELEKLLPKIG